MISVSLIFFRLLPSRLLPAGLLLTAAAYGATVGGRVELTNPRGSPARQKNFTGVAVWLEPVNGPAPKPAAGTHTILQKGKRFTPHVSVVPVGTTVDWPNRDPIFHNAFSNFAGQPFDTGLYAPGSTYKVRFVRDGVVRVFCNIHSTMSAVIVVVKTPWYAVTDRDGSFRIDNVPPGEYVMKLWHERAPEAGLKSLERRITVGGEGAALPVVTISESRIPPPPHKNKYGREYGPEPDEKAAYGGKPK
jgi:plastocyanin